MPLDNGTPSRPGPMSFRWYKKDRTLFDPAVGEAYLAEEHAQISWQGLAVLGTKAWTLRLDKQKTKQHG